MNVFYNSMQICVSMVSTFNINFNCQPKSRHVGKHLRGRFKPNFERFECAGRVYWVNWNSEMPVSPTNSAIDVGKYAIAIEGAFRCNVRPWGANCI